MNKKAALALCIAILIPLVSYLFVKFASESAIDMPRNYLLDSVTSTVKDGRLTTDSVWHKVANITLQNQLGNTVSLYDLQGKIVVADFFFTSCASICPTLTRNMLRLQRSFLKGGDTREKIDTSVVQFISFSIDPERDSATRLKNYADRFGVDHDNWWFLTGSKDSIYNFAFEQLKVDKYSDVPIDPNFIHTGRFVLIDKNHFVRGYYNGLDTLALSKLAQDIGLLMVEKDKTQPAVLPFDPVLMGIFFAITIVIVVVVIRLIFYNKKEQANYVAGNVSKK